MRQKQSWQAFTNTVILGMLSISHLYVYPIKSLGGIELSSARLTDRGIEHDRRWMLVDEDNRFLTQREFPQMALLRTAIHANELTVYEKGNEVDKIRVNLYPAGNGTVNVQVWDDVCEALQMGDAANQWFSEKLKRVCKLVYMPDASKRKVDTDYALNNEITGFSDAFPLLMIGQASLDDLNSRLEIPVPMNRFRPNIVFTGGAAFEEDTMKHFQINGIDLYAVKPCARCAITTTDQKTGATAKEPLKTLASYRTGNNKVYFGQNILYKQQGTITVGDELKVVQRKESLQLNA
ncbi:MOSC domain-containing protein [Lacibacter sp.]|uniref:MOSC domain-containing protein n=1 Tax=Lacibacter sp. TaxID=1915409 RepID=UPI002B4B02A4|nr:MOSC N-terminal beta barrel domain-containing protein [Lacibacter sp.]HLP35797.1 MOSC N-terminal beta barrel domain-containing protein [Lacibacter sp.]